MHDRFTGAPGAGVYPIAAMFDVLTAGVLAVRKNGCVQSANAGASRILRREVLVGCDVGELIAPLTELDGPAASRRQTVSVRAGDGTQVALDVAVGSYGDPDLREEVTTVMFHDRGVVPAHVSIHAGRPAAVDVVVAETCELVRSLAEARGVRLACVGGELPLLRLDRDVLRCAVLHLVRNAVEACPDAARVTVDARIVGDYFELEVRDTGKGMTPEVRARCTELFFTGGAGSGIGLALCRRIAESSRGELRVSSRYGLGTEVVLRVPLERRLRGSSCSACT